MVEFEYQPWKKIVVHEVTKFPVQFFVSDHTLGVEPGGVGRPIAWADSIIFRVSHFRDTDDVIREKLDGVLHWSALQYAVLEPYQDEFKVSPGNIRIPIMNVSDNEIFRDMALWVKANFEAKEA